MLLGPFLLLISLVWGGGESLPAAFVPRLCAGLLALEALRASPATSRLYNPFDLLAATFLVYSLVSFAWSIYPWAAIQHAMNLSAVILFYFILRRNGLGLNRNGWAADSLWHAVAAAAAISAAYAGFQWALVRGGRPGGFYVNPNFQADLLGMGFIVALGLAWREPPRAAWRKGGWIAISLLVACALVLARSRSLLPMTGALAIFLLFVRRGKRLSTGLISVVFLSPIAVWLLPRFLAAGDPFSMSRLPIWRAAWKSAIVHPFGVGLGGYRFSWLLYREPLFGAIYRYGKTAETAHSLLFGTLAELGFPGLILLGAIGVYAAMLIGREARRADRFLPLCCIPVVAAAHAVFDVGLTLPGLAMPVAACAAALANRNERGVAGTLSLSASVRWILAFPIILAVAYAGSSALAVIEAERGKEAIRDGRFGVARSAYERAGVLDPLCSAYPDAVASIDYRFFLGTGKESFLASAIQFEHDAHFLSPADPLHLSQIGFLMEAHAETAATPGETVRFRKYALAQFERSLARDPHSVVVLRRMASIREKSGELEKARLLLEQAVVLEPNDVQSILALAGIVESVDPGRARNLYNGVLSLRAGLAGKTLEPGERKAIAFDEAQVLRRMNALADPGENHEGKRGRSDGMIERNDLQGGK